MNLRLVQQARPVHRGTVDERSDPKAPQTERDDKLCGAERRVVAPGRARAAMRVGVRVECRELRRLVIVVLLTLLCGCQDAVRPSILLVTVDTLRADPHSADSLPAKSRCAGSLPAKPLLLLQPASTVATKSIQIRFLFSDPDEHGNRENRYLSIFPRCRRLHPEKS